MRRKKKDRVGIHTVVDKETYRRIMYYGKGVLNQGIETLVKIANSKEIKVVIITEVKLEND